MKLIVALSSLLLASNAMAARWGGTQVTCVLDQTPVDGPRITVVLQPTRAGTHDVKVNTYNPWTDISTDETLATDLKCNFGGSNPVFTACHRAARSGESQNSGFKLHQIQDTGVDHQGNLVTTTKWIAEIYSPAVEELRQTFEFQQNGCRAVAVDYRN